MHPTRTLPENYRLEEKLELKNDRQAIITISLASLLILPPAGWLFFQILFWLRPEEAAESIQFQFDGLLSILIFLISILLAYIFMIVLHEAIHGLFFWLATREKPFFGFRIYYAYAAAPDWYLPRSLYLLNCLAPLMIISLLGCLLLAFIPPSWFLLVLFVILANASGSAGDLYVATWLLKQPENLLANDQGDIFTLYLPKDQETE